MEFLRSLKKEDILDLFSHEFCSHCQALLHSRITTLRKRKVDEICSLDDECFESSGDHVVEMSFNDDASNSESLTKRNESPRNCSQRRDSDTSVKDDEKRVFGSSSGNLVGCKQSDFELLLNDGICEGSSFKNGLSEERKEQIRYSLVCSKKDFSLIERINGRHINVLQGLELHTEVFNELEQRKIVEWIYRLQWRGQQGKLKDRTYSEPRKWMRGKGRVTIQFGCCYNYAVNKSGIPPGIMRDEEVDPLPPVFKQMIKRMVRWNIIPSSCIPDSCIVNIYEEGDCIPPHIDNHDFMRPFYTVSFLSECKILFGSNLQVVSAGEFAGPISLFLPVGSVFVLNGNGADIAKHCIPSVSSKRISITFRKMQPNKLPYKFSPDTDLAEIKPLVFSSLNK
ncbi:alkylated DNA repair protein alkB-like protein 8 [Vigna unguiculata]|uniref:Alkylated DNA repair protein alkB-like protein 8 n=1 Tax=Vigna unguiculata TaxID=3917 RepID=A0A4D6KJE3_VIGUN|nr:alkylated DNA repair protein alkB-like protein 8 [Vigna unguiculata]